MRGISIIISISIIHNHRKIIDISSRMMTLLHIGNRHPYNPTIRIGLVTTGIGINGIGMSGALFSVAYRQQGPNIAKYFQSNSFSIIAINHREMGN
jgi:hypothetical protein